MGRVKPCALRVACSVATAALIKFDKDAKRTRRTWARTAIVLLLLLLLLLLLPAHCHCKSALRAHHFEVFN